MSWEIEFERAAAREFRKLDQQTQRRIRDFFQQKVLPAKDPRALDKAMRGTQSEFWRYRVGPYRIIASIQDQRMLILLLRVGHRRDVYR